RLSVRLLHHLHFVGAELPGRVGKRALDMTRVWQSLVILTVSAAMLAEAITAKTQMAETGVLTVAVLFLIPLAFAPSLTHIVRDGHFLARHPAAAPSCRALSPASAPA